MTVDLTEGEYRLLLTCLNVAETQFIKDSIECSKKPWPGAQRLAEQFDKQADETGTLARKLEELND